MSLKKSLRGFDILLLLLSGSLILYLIFRRKTSFSQPPIQTIQPNGGPTKETINIIGAGPADVAAGAAGQGAGQTESGQKKLTPEEVKEKKQQTKVRRLFSGVVQDQGPKKLDLKKKFSIPPRNRGKTNPGQKTPGTGGTTSYRRP